MSDSYLLGATGLADEISLAVTIDRNDAEGVFLQMPDGHVLYDGRTLGDEPAQTDD